MSIQIIKRDTVEGNRVEDQFEQLFHTYHKKLYFYFIKKTGSEFLSEELVQLTFIKFWKNFGKIPPEKASFSSQIFCIARSTLIDALFTRTCQSCPPTIPVENPNKAIDFIAFRPAGKFSIKSHQVISEKYASDHLPVIADIAVQP